MPVHEERLNESTIWCHHSPGRPPRRAFRRDCREVEIYISSPETATNDDVLLPRGMCTLTAPKTLATDIGTASRSLHHPYYRLDPSASRGTRRVSGMRTPRRSRTRGQSRGQQPAAHGRLLCRIVGLVQVETANARYRHFGGGAS